MDRKPKIIIHFDDGSYLEHFGVPGMKWGVRKKVGEAISKVGTKIGNASFDAARLIGQKVRSKYYDSKDGALDKKIDVAFARMSAKLGLRLMKLGSKLEYHAKDHPSMTKYLKDIGGRALSKAKRAIGDKMFEFKQRRRGVSRVKYKSGLARQYA